MTFNGVFGNTTCTFGAWLKGRRKARDLTQLELAGQVGCAVVTIQKFERNVARPSKSLATRLAKILELPTEEWPGFVAFARHVTETHVGIPSMTYLNNADSHQLSFSYSGAERSHDNSLALELLTDQSAHFLALASSEAPDKTDSESTNLMRRLPETPVSVSRIQLALVSPDHPISNAVHAIELLVVGSDVPIEQLFALLSSQQLVLILNVTEKYPIVHSFLHSNDS